MNTMNIPVGTAEPAHPTELSHAFDRLKEEHEVLKVSITSLEEQASSINSSQDPAAQLELLRKLRGETLQLMSSMKTHSEWEERILFPFLHEYFDLSIGPTMVPSFWVLEKDHDLAEAYMESFVDAVETLAYPGEPNQLIGVAEHLTQACHILKGHLEMEEQLVYPLSEQVLTDVDYFFS
jgi:regulator of cell morphogenesis and NO signaling